MLVLSDKLVVSWRQLDLTMEVLRPALINIKGRLYRRNNTKEDQYEEEEEFSYMDTAGKLNESSSHTQATTI